MCDSELPKNRTNNYYGLSIEAIPKSPFERKTFDWNFLGHRPTISRLLWTLDSTRVLPGRRIIVETPTEVWLEDVFVEYLRHVLTEIKFNCEQQTEWSKIAEIIEGKESCPFQVAQLLNLTAKFTTCYFKITLTQRWPKYILLPYFVLLLLLNLDELNQECLNIPIKRKCPLYILCLSEWFDWKTAVP